MKEISELKLPQDLKYSKEHEWAQQSGGNVRVGITDFAQDQLGDIVFVELPEVGSSFGQQDECATIESVKAVSEVYIPVSGEIVAINGSLEQSPELVNQDPYGQGWLMDIKPSNTQELEGLLDKEAYLQLLQGEQ